MKMRPKGLTRSNLHELLGRNRSITRINEAMQRLLELKLVRCEKRLTATRPATVWVACA